MNLYLGFNASGVPRPVSLAKLSLRVLNGGGGRVSGVSSTSWSEGTINFSNAPAIGSPILQMPGSSRDGTIGANLTSGVNADADGVLSLALTTTGGQLDYHSKEDGQPPRLVVAVSCAAAADADGDGRGDPCDCAPADPGVFAPPTEVAHLRWSDASHLAWDSDAANSGAATRYDLMSGNLSAVSSMGSGPGDVCRGSALGGTQTADASPVPSAGAGFFFLVRATNTCGKSRYETASDGRDRLATACP
jgi:hypothetical protein